MHKLTPDADGYIYPASIRLKNGRRIYAHTYGLQCFKIYVGSE